MLALFRDAAAFFFSAAAVAVREDHFFSVTVTLDMLLISFHASPPSACFFQIPSFTAPGARRDTRRLPADADVTAAHTMLVTHHVTCLCLCRYMILFLHFFYTACSNDMTTKVRYATFHESTIEW